MSPLALAWEQFRFERKLFWRNPSAAFFNFVLPLLLLVLIASAFGSDAGRARGADPRHRRHERDGHDLHRAGLRDHLPARGGHPQAGARHADADGLVHRRDARLGRGNAFVQVALVVVDRQPRLRRRLAGAPALRWSASPRSAWSASARSGVAFSHAIPNMDSAPAYVNAVFLPLIFISGVFYSAESLPPVLEGIAEALPLKHLIDCLSYAIVGGELRGHGPGGRGRLDGRRARAGGALLPLGLAARAEAHARGGAATPRARATPGSARRAATRSARSGRAPRGGPPRARPRSRGSPRAPAAGAS